MLAALSLAALVSAQPAATAPAKPEPVAIVELFTSEGCSSCPPADRLLSQLVAEAQKIHTRIYPLAFHVDYWDNLGWKDPYATPAFTARQREYGAAFKGAGLYTPQMIVNGSAQFVGSDESQARREIQQALKLPATITITASPALQGSAIKLTIAASPALGPDQVVNVALVESKLSSPVKRGENAGSTLKHDHVVRVFRTVTASEFKEGKADAALELPASANAANCAVIVYAQDADSRRILGATETAIPAARTNSEPHTPP